MYQSDKLKQKREELGLDQQELAELIGVSKQAYFKWEKGLSKPTKANIAKLENVLNVPAGYLSEDLISSLYKQLTEPNQEKAITYVRDLISSQNVVSIVEKRSEYHGNLLTQAIQIIVLNIVASNPNLTCFHIIKTRNELNQA